MQKFHWITFQGPAQHDALITFNYSRAFWFARTLYTNGLDPIYNPKGEEGGEMCATKEALRQTSENAPSYNVWTAAGASSISVESAATQVSVDLSATDSAANPHLI